MLLRKKSVSIGFLQIARHSRSCGTIDVHREQLQHERQLPPSRVQRRWPRWIRAISRSCDAAALVQGCHQQWSRVRPHVRRGTISTPFRCCFGAGPLSALRPLSRSSSLRISTSCWMDALQFTLRDDLCAPSAPSIRFLLLFYSPIVFWPLTSTEWRRIMRQW